MCINIFSIYWIYEESKSVYLHSLTILKHLYNQVQLWKWNIDHLLNFRSYHSSFRAALGCQFLTRLGNSTQNSRKTYLSLWNRDFSRKDCLVCRYALAVHHEVKVCGEGRAETLEKGFKTEILLSPWNSQIVCVCRSRGGVPPSWLFYSRWPAIFGLQLFQWPESQSEKP